MAESKFSAKKMDTAFIELALPINVKKTIMQPNRITTASMSYNRRQMDILILILERMKMFMEEILTKKIHVEQLDIFQQPNVQMVSFEIPIKDFGLSPKRYAELKQDLADMATIPVRFQQVDQETGQRMEFASGLYTVKMPVAWGRAIQIQIHKDIARHYIDVTKGYTLYDKQLALSLKSAYAKRLYMFISSWKAKGGTAINIETFREIMNVVDKYPSYKDLYRWVIKPCYERLKEEADCWFEVSPCYHDSEKQPYQLVFKIISQPQSAFEENKLVQQKEYIKSALYQLGLKSTNMLIILNKIHPGNVVKATGKVYDLVQNHMDRNDISDYDAYYSKAMLNFLEEK